MGKWTEPAVKKKLQSREATAQQASVHVRTIDKLIRDGKIEAVQVGRRVMVKVASADRFFGD
jgi:excisionase family DNA binding protein